MSTSASGVVRNDDDKKGIAGLRVVLDDISQQYEVRLNEQEDPNTHQKKKDLTGADGTFNLTYAADAASSSEPGQMPRQLRLRVMLGQHILAENVQTDPRGQDHLTFPPIELKRGEDTCRFATLGGGTASRFSTGNAIRWLVDNEEAWGHSADVIKDATILDVMELGIEVDKYQLDVEREKPKIVLRFDPAKALFDPAQPLVDPEKVKLTATTNPRAMDANDQRVERMMLERFQKGMNVRIQIPRMTWALKAFEIGGVLALGSGLLLLLPFQLSSLFRYALYAGLGAGVLLLLGDFIAPALINSDFDESDLEDWFKTATADFHTAGGTNQVRVRELRLRSLFVTHAKIIIDRVPVESDATKTVGKRAVLLGSPFKQVYFDSFRLRDPDHPDQLLKIDDTRRGGHYIDDPRRGGDATKGPIHDVSVAIRGPAVGYLQEMFDLHWNQADPNDKLTIPTLQDPASFPKPVDAAKGEFSTSLQVVRTLDRQFTGQTHKGESGILEAYLRMIHFATDFIYIENQYFKNDRITDALMEALEEKPNLVVILLLNVNPDEPFLPRWQRQTIERLVNCVKNKDGVADPLKDSKRLGVFSAWAHAPGNGQNKPRLVDHYLHTKTAIIDNLWATVGSANLDDASHDFVDFARSALDGDPRNSETNIVIYEDPPVQPSAVDVLRRTLWAEHLGVTENAIELNAPANKTWVEVWRDQAEKKLTGLKNNPNQPSPIRVLRWASVGFSGNHKVDHRESKDYLKLLFQDDNALNQFQVLGKRNKLPSIPFAYPFKE